MSQAKMFTVQRAQKGQGECERCHAPIVRGDAYRWFKVGFRSNYKRVRCMKSECTPKPSERESSKLSEVYRLQEDFTVDVCEGVTELEEALRDFADAVREVAQEYEDASVNPDTGVVFNTEAEERGQALNEWADEIESTSFEDPPDRDDFEDHDDEAWDIAMTDWIEEQQGVCNAAVQECPV